MVNRRFNVIGDINFIGTPCHSAQVISNNFLHSLSSSDIPQNLCIQSFTSILHSKFAKLIGNIIFPKKVYEFFGIKIECGI